MTSFAVRTARSLNRLISRGLEGFGYGLGFARPRTVKLHSERSSAFTGTMPVRLQHGPGRILALGWGLGELELFDANHAFPSDDHERSRYH